MVPRKGYEGSPGGYLGAGCTVMYALKKSTKSALMIRVCFSTTSTRGPRGCYRRKAGVHSQRAFPALVFLLTCPLPLDTSEPFVFN